MDGRVKPGHDALMCYDPGSAQQHFVLQRVRETERMMRRPLRLIRNVVLTLIAAVLLLTGVLLFNVFTLSSRQIQVAAVPRAEVDAQGAAARLAEAIRFRTIS